MGGCGNCDNFDPVPDSIAVQDDSVPVGSFQTFNFTGAGVTATDAGGGIVDIAIPGFVDTKQVFRYTVTGAEPNPFPVALPAARASANYNVQLTLGGPLGAAFVDYRPDVASFANNTFNVECTLPLAGQVGDILQFTVEDLT